MKRNQKTYNEAFLGYLWETLSKSKGLLPHKEISAVFLLALNDYFKKIIDGHTLSSIATSLYYDFNKPSSFDSNPASSALGNLLSLTSDLEWFTKNQSEKEINGVLTKLRKYYEDSKR